jgi:hypothetical protein
MPIYVFVVCTFVTSSMDSRGIGEISSFGGVGYAQNIAKYILPRKHVT